MELAVRSTKDFYANTVNHEEAFVRMWYNFLIIDWYVLSVNCFQIENILFYFFQNTKNYCQTMLI